MIKIFSKKLIVLLTVALIAILLTGLFSAHDIGYNGGADSVRGIAIENIEFNIPEGYEKNDTKNIINQRNTTGNNAFVYNQQTYENSAGEEIIIIIADYDDFDVDVHNLKGICKGGKNKTLMGYSGYISSNENYYQFTYAFNNKAVTIRAPNEDLINQILVVEDA